MKVASPGEELSLGYTRKLKQRCPHVSAVGWGIQKLRAGSARLDTYPEGRWACGTLRGVLRLGEKRDVLGYEAFGVQGPWRGRKGNRNQEPGWGGRRQSSCLRNAVLGQDKPGPSSLRSVGALWRLLTLSGGRIFQRSAP